MDKQTSATSEAAKEEETAAATTEESTEESTETTEEGAQSTSKDDELALAKELEEEQKRTADLDKARERFQKNHAKPAATATTDADDTTDSDDEDDDDKPLTRRELREAETRLEKKALVTSVLSLARAMAGSETEAQLIAAKWQNRTFPEGMTLQDQVEEAYAITHRKKLIGERQEALRALKGKGTATTTATESHRDPSPGNEPKMAAQDKAAILAAGFAWDATKRLYKKSLGRRGFLYKDPKSGKTFTGA